MPGVSSEADLVVDDDVYGPVGGVRGQIRQMHRLEHHALPGERRVTVEEDRHHLGTKGSRCIGIIRPSQASNHLH